MIKASITLIFIIILITPCYAEKLLCTTKTSKSFSFDEITQLYELTELNIQRKYILETPVANGEIIITKEGDAEPLIVCPPISNNVMGYTRCNNALGVFKFSSSFRRFTYWHAFTESQEGVIKPGSPSVEFGRCSNYQEQQKSST